MTSDDSQSHGMLPLNTMLHYVIMLSYFQVAKKYFCTYAPRLDISLKNNTTTFKYAHDLPVAVFYAMVFANKIFSQRKYFFLEFINLFRCLYTLF